MEELNFRSWRYILQNQGDMVSFDVRNTHVACEWLSGNDNGRCFLKSQHSEECLRALNISHDDCQMIKSFSMLHLCQVHEVLFRRPSSSHALLGQFLFRILVLREARKA